MYHNESITSKIVVIVFSLIQRIILDTRNTVFILAEAVETVREVTSLALLLDSCLGQDVDLLSSHLDGEVEVVLVVELQHRLREISQPLSLRAVL